MKTLTFVTTLTLIGMVGLYILLYKAYAKYQETTAKGTLGGVLTSLAGN